MGLVVNSTTLESIGIVSKSREIILFKRANEMSTHKLGFASQRMIENILFSV